MPTTPSAWRLSPWAAAKWAGAIGVFISTQYLAQPFVWENWPIAEVIEGWIEIARDRLIVAATIAFALVVVTHAGARTVLTRASLIAAAVVCGALAGELLLVALDMHDDRVDAASVAGRVAQWSGLGLCVAGMYSLWSRDRDALASTRAVKLQQSAIEASVVQTHLQSLRQQIDPHFLFNTLATIRSFGETDVPAGARLLRHLGEYLRSTMPSDRHQTTLGEELDLVTSYLAIVAIRLAGRVTVSVDIPASLRPHLCPPLTLATLVENAVKHGITPCAAGGAILITARKADGGLHIIVADTGAGLSPVGAGSGIGLANVRARLRALHGTAASLTIEGNEPRGVRATIRLPLEGRGTA
jgi:signal transduction histidine kinase